MSTRRASPYRARPTWLPPVGSRGARHAGAVHGEQVTMRGIIGKVFYASPVWSAALVAPEVGGESVKCAGAFYARESEHVIITGKWKLDATHGMGITVESAAYVMPADSHGLARYIADNPAFIGFGPTKAARMADYVTTHFAGDLSAALAHAEPAALAKACGVTPEKLAALASEWTAREGTNAAATFMASFGLSSYQIMTVIEEMGATVTAVLQDDPFLLLGLLPRFGFKRLDVIARKMGIAKDNPSRCRHGLAQCVRDAANSEGHTVIEGKDLLAAGLRMLGLDTAAQKDLLPARLAELVACGALKSQVISGQTFYAMPHLFSAESSIIAALAGAWKASPAFPRMAGPAIGAILRTHGATLNDAQRAAVTMVLTHALSVVTGPAGSGKSYLLATICEIADALGAKITMCAPTGKAAQRMMEATGREASTIHMMLGYTGKTFKRTEPLPSGLLVADECFHPRQAILTEDGWQGIGKVVNTKSQVRVWSVAKDGSLVLRPIVRHIRRDPPVAMLSIDASRAKSRRDARVIRCTPDHKVFTPSGLRRAGDLAVGDEVIVRGRGFTKEQRSILVGSILGDGSLNRGDGARTSPQASLMNGDAQRDYLEFKHRAFGTLAGPIEKSKSGYCDNVVWRFSVDTLDETYRLAEETFTLDTHPSGRRRWSMSDSFIARIDEQALAIWYLDNGSLQARTLRDGTSAHYARMHSERFSAIDNARLAEHLLRRFGIEAKVMTASRGFYNLAFGKIGTQRLFATIAPFVPACMARKVGGAGSYEYAPATQPQTTVARVRSTGPLKTRHPCRYVYDLEVEETHNYIAGNFVVSNCSMVDSVLLAELLARVDPTRTAVLLVGDHHQLPPVGPGAPLRDMLRLHAAPVVILDQVMRQAGLLKANSTAILSGHVAPSQNKAKGDTTSEWFVLGRQGESAEDNAARVLDLATNLIPDRLGFDPIADVQVLSPMHARANGVQALNRALQRALQKKVYGVEIPETSAGPDAGAAEVEPGAEPRKPSRAAAALYLGDKVIHKRNDYAAGVMNGTQGRVRWAGVIGDPLTSKRRAAVVVFAGRHVLYTMAGEPFAGDAELSQAHAAIPEGLHGLIDWSAPASLKDLHLAYALTVHSVQGSEFLCALVVCHKAHTIMHRRELLYTAVTRAKKTVLIVGDSWAITNCASADTNEERRTWMPLLLGGLRRSAEHTPSSDTQPEAA